MADRYCSNCNYDLRCSLDTCPECGREFDVNKPKTYLKKQLPARSGWGLFGVACLLIATLVQVFMNMYDAHWCAVVGVGRMHSVYFRGLNSLWDYFLLLAHWLLVPIAGSYLIFHGTRAQRSLARMLVKISLLTWMLCFVMITWRRPIAGFVSWWWEYFFPWTKWG
tara:strand:- start:3925 stop:4422 length:498 start_codon:yes stop_codon:yes gene_type:complete